MEFKYRAVDDKPLTTFFSPASSFTYFAEQAMRAGSSGPDFRPNLDVMGNSDEVHLRYAIQREIEKERIREEIITAEMERRRVLEAEVRREMAIEREMAMRRAAEMGLSFEERLTMRFDPMFPFVPNYENRWLGGRWALAAAGSGGGYNVFPPPLPLLPEAMGAEFKPASESNKDKLIVLARPDPTLSGAKRKAVMPPAVSAGQNPLFGLKKKPKEEWSCALCQVSSTSERGLNEHLQGRKHKAREAGLRAQNMAKNFSSVALPKGTTKASKLTESKRNAGSEIETKVEKKSLQIDKTGDSESSDPKGTENSKNKNYELPSKKQAETLKKKNRKGTVERVECTPESREKKFKFWCEICAIGAFSEVVMEAHKKGKKHIFQLKELSKNDEAVPTTASADSTRSTTTASAATTNTATATATTTVSSEATEKAKNEDVVAKKTNRKTVENIVAADGPSPSQLVNQ